jgi:hypothetical protein
VGVFFPRRQLDRTSDAPVVDLLRSEGVRPSPDPRCTTLHSVEAVQLETEEEDLARRQRRLVKRRHLETNRDTFREQGPFVCSRRHLLLLERAKTRGARDQLTLRWTSHRPVLVTPTRNLAHAGALFATERASGHRFAGPSPRVAPEKRDQLGHRSHAPATFFEVRFASLFEARCRLFVSAITRLTGITRWSSRIPARRGPRPSSSSQSGPPFRERALCVQATRLRPCRPTHVFPTGPRRRRDWFPNPADMNSRWLDACDTANSARQMPGARREGRRTKRRTRHRNVHTDVVTQVAIAWRWPTEVPLLGGLRTPGSLA